MIVWQTNLRPLMTRSTGVPSGKAAGGGDEGPPRAIGTMAFGGLGLAINEVMDFILMPAEVEEDDDASFSKKQKIVKSKYCKNKKFVKSKY